MTDETTKEEWHEGGDVTLLQAITDKTIPKPSRVEWRDWQIWRKNPFGGRRATKRQGSTRPTTTAEESSLWQATMQELYGENWLSDMHGAEEEEAQVQEEEEEEVPQVASSASKGLPPGLEQVASSAGVPGPNIPLPKTPPPASQRTLSPLRTGKTTPASSVGTRGDLPQDSSARRLEASPIQKLKDFKANFPPPTHRGFGFLDASKGGSWKGVPAFPKGGAGPNTRSFHLGRQVSEPSLSQLGPDQDEEASEEPSAMPKTRMICKCCGQKNGPDVDVCFHCGEQLYDEPEEVWDKDTNWDEGDSWWYEEGYYEDWEAYGNEEADGESAYTGCTADSMTGMTLDQARQEFQDDWDPAHETKDDFETRIQRACRTLEGHKEFNPVAYTRVLMRANYLEQALLAMRPEDPYENGPAIARLKTAYSEATFSSSLSIEEIEQHVAVITELLQTRWKVAASRFVGKVWSNDTTPDDRQMQLNKEREAAMAPPGTRPAGKSSARPGTAGGGVGTGLTTPDADDICIDARQPGLRRSLLAGLDPTCVNCGNKVAMRQSFCAECGQRLHDAADAQAPSGLRNEARPFVPATAGSQEASSALRSPAIPRSQEASSALRSLGGSDSHSVAPSDGASIADDPVMIKLMGALVEANTNTSAALVKLTTQKDGHGGRVHSTMRVQIPTDWPKYGDDGVYDLDPKRFYFHLENMFCLANDGAGLSWHERWIGLGHKP